MAISLIAHTVVGGTGAGSITTSGIDTTGSNLICIYVSSDSGGSTAVSDSNGNTYTPLTVHGTTNPTAARLYYCLNPTVGTGHTVTYGTTGFPSVAVGAFGGVDSFYSQNGNSVSPSATIQAGSVTPSIDGALIVTGIGSQVTPASIDSSFTITDSINLASGTHYAVGMAYLIQTTAATVNPTWTTSVSTNSATSIAVFLPPGSPGNSPQPVVLILT